MFLSTSSLRISHRSISRFFRSSFSCLPLHSHHHSHSHSYHLQQPAEDNVKQVKVYGIKPREEHSDTKKNHTRAVNSKDI